MKLRLRLKKITRVIEVSDEIAENFTVQDLCGAALDAFQDVISGGFFLSLNNKDALEDCKKLVSECDIVSGDLIHIVPSGDWYETQASASSCMGESSSRSSVSSNPPSSCSSKSGDNTNNPNNVATDSISGGSKQCINADSVLTEPGPSKVQDENIQENQMAEDNASTMGECSMETSETDLIIVKQCLSEPTLCRESTDGRLPALLKELYDNTQPKVVAESLSIVLHVLMLETGFNVYPESEAGTMTKLPENFRCTGCYRLTYTYPGCQDTQCTVTIVPTGGTVVAHGKVTGTECARKCSLKPYEFVLNVTEDCTECYCQLAKLSRIFKDAMCIPLVHDIRQASGLPDLIGLLALTQEIKLKILSLLDVRSLLQMSCVSQEFLEVCGDPYIWRRLYLKEFGNRSDTTLSQNWKRLYRLEFKARKERRKALSRMRMVTPPYWGPQNPYGGASNWIPPPMPGGIIGGDYDLFSNFPGGYPGIPSRMGPQPPVLPRPRYDLIGPAPDVEPDPDLIPSRPTFSGRGGSGRSGPFGYGGFGPTGRFF